MSASQLRCPGCGSTNIVEDDLYCQHQMVCVDCGSVVSEGFLAADPLDGTAVSYSRTTAVAKKPCKNLIIGLQRLRAICRILRVNSEIEDLSDTYYNQAYRHQSFINVTLHKKHVLAGCCVLVSCRMHNWPITMGTVGYLVDADPMEVGGVYQDMVKVLNIEAPIVGVTDVMAAHSEEYKLGSAHVPEELAETSKDLTKRAAALAELAADSWIVTGRKPAPVMMAAVYLAWQSLKPCKLRLKFSLAKFCQMAKVRQEKQAMKRIAEMKEVLCKLGAQLPWIREAVTPDNVVLQVGDILQHRSALMRRALKRHEEENPPQASEPVSQTTGESSVEQCEESAARTEQTQSEDKLSDAQQSKESNWGKRELFAPPCVIHCKKRRAERPELRDVTGDEEISDSEIDSYIRTPQEAREFALTQGQLNSSDSRKS